MIKMILKVIGIAFLGVIGGFLSPFFIVKILGWFDISHDIGGMSDTISIANTYIVFTTFIFTAIAIIIAIASYIFSQEAAKSRDAQEKALFSSLIESCNKNPEEGKALISKLLENEHVIEHFEKMLNDKIDVILSNRSKKTEEQQREFGKQAEKLNSMIGKNR